MRFKAIQVDKCLWLGCIECLKKRIFPLYRKHNIPPLYWPDSASAQYAKTTLDLMNTNKMDFIQKDDNPSNFPQLPFAKKACDLNNALY